MWQRIVQWLLDIFSRIGEYASMLFTPVNINVISQSLDEFYTDTNRAGLTNVPTWLYKLLQKTAEPIMVTPIEILSVGLITTLIVWGLVKNIWSN